MKTLLENLYRFLYRTNIITPAEPQTPCVKEEEKLPVEKDSDKLYKTAISFLGSDASPKDYASDEYSCMETVDTIYYKCFGNYINPANIRPSISTNETYKYLLISNAFTHPSTPAEGDIIISPTSYGNGGLNHGHIGILGKNNIIMSNSSSTGRFEENYTITTWKSRYKDIGGFPIVYFRKV